MPTGRGKLGELLTDEEFEDILARLYSLSKRAQFHMKTTEAQHYRRYILQQQVLEKKTNWTRIAGSSVQEWRSQSLYDKPEDFVFPSERLHGSKPLDLASVLKKKIQPAFRRIGIAV